MAGAEEQDILMELMMVSNFGDAVRGHRYHQCFKSQ